MRELCNELEMINEHSNTFQSDLNQFVEKINKIFIDTSQETFGNKIYYKSSKVNRPWLKYNILECFNYVYHVDSLNRKLTHVCDSEHQKITGQNQ
jgi:hypothetical protein